MATHTDQALQLLADPTDDEREELLAQERRTLFVGMTRAMRALLLVVPSRTDTPLLQGFAPGRWNLTSA